MHGLTGGQREVTGTLVASLRPGKVMFRPPPFLHPGVNMRPGCLVCKLLATPSPDFLMSRKTKLLNVLANE